MLDWYSLLFQQSITNLILLPLQLVPSAVTVVSVFPSLSGAMDTLMVVQMAVMREDVVS